VLPLIEYLYFFGKSAKNTDFVVTLRTNDAANVGTLLSGGQKE